MPQTISRSTFILSLSLITTLFSCGEAPKPTESKPIIKVREAAEPASINPFFIRDELGFYVCSQIWQPLLAVDYEKEELVGVLAEGRPKIESNEQWPMMIKYQLRTNAQFSNGKPLKYSDVLFSLKANLSPLVNPFYSGYYEFIDSISVDCKDSSCFTIYSDDTYYLSEFSSGDYFIVSEDQFDPDHTLRKYSISELKMASDTADSMLVNYAKQIQAIDFRDSTPTIGTAPYQLSEWSPGEKISLEKNQDWWGEDLRNLNSYFKADAQAFAFYFVEDATTAINALENSDFDIMRAIPPKQYRRLEKDSGFNQRFDLVSTPRFAYQYLGFNLRNPLLQDIQLRKAIAFSLPTKEIIDNLYYGLASPCNSIQPKADQNQAQDGSRFTQDLDSANAYLNAFKAKHPNTSVSLTYTYNAGNDKRKAIGLILKESLKKLGIEINIESYEWTVYLQKLRAGEVDLFLNGTVNSVTTPDLSNSFHSSAIESGRNYFYYQDERSDQLLDSIHDCLDPELRNKLFVQLEDRIFDQLPILPLIQPMETIAFSKRLKHARAYRLRPNYWVAEISVE
jgi:peptide/nickel transport system substrate-binding protein